MTTSSPSHGRDPGVTLIRISPARIQTQVTQTVRYRPVRSLLLLGLLVVISLFVLFTLSQMAVVQHTMMAQLETGRPGGGGWVGVNGGGRASRPAPKPWRSQYNQFKIEPLLIRNAPSVEVNSALAANRRRAGQIAAIIVRNSLLVTQSPYYNLTIQQSNRHPALQSPPSGHHPSPSLNVSYPSRAPLPFHPGGILTHNQTTGDTISSSPVTTVSNHSSLINLTDKSRATRRTDALATSANSSSSTAPSQSRLVPDNSTRERENASRHEQGFPTEMDVQGRKINSEEREGKEKNNVDDGQEYDSSVRRRFFTKLKCDDSSDDSSYDCNTKPLYNNHNALVNRPLAREEPIRNHNHDKKEPTASQNNSNGDSVQRTVDEKDVQERPEDIGNPVKSSVDVAEKDSEPLPTEFSEAERDFEPLYLREDDDYDTPKEKGAATKASPTSDHVEATRKTLTDDQLRKLPMCPEIPPGLLGRLDINLDCLEQLRLSEVLKQLEWVLPGGKWSPAYEPSNPCLPRHKVAVVLPYRDRLHHLIILLSWLHPILRRQQLEYTIYVAEQAGNATFNKGSIMNAGFMEAWQRSDANCFVFHDVDLLPEDDRNMYSCPPQPRHLSVGVDTLGYKLPYFLLVGGVLSVRGDHFLRLNGYSNMYWGWGGEDDDMGYRIKQSGLSITRPPNMLARYTMIRHLKRRPLTWKVRGKLVRTSGRRYRLDGLNTLKYSLLALHKHPLFTHLLLDVGTPPENLMRLDAH